MSNSVDIAMAEQRKARQQGPLTVAGQVFSSRLLVGTGKYRDMAETEAAIRASGSEIVTVAIRRTNIGQNADEPNLLDVISPKEFTILPNTAGCYNVEDTLRTCRLARELLGDHKLMKLEVLGDAKTLYPDVPATLEAAEQLVKEGFDCVVMARALIHDAALINKFKSGEVKESGCNNCNACVAYIYHPNGTWCVMNPPNAPKLNRVTASQ